ncbi:MAG TPA: CocE/NonD family hydrolase [Isosphaeraceae bacterium]|nr:CocE/NonD family hydrolase [Isosphaeraceae bacterium]
MRWFDRTAPGAARGLAVGLMAWAAVVGAAPTAAGFDVQARYRKSEQMIPMRDGVRLHTTIYEPRQLAGPLPVLLLRTPYGCAPYGPEAYRRFLGPSPHSSEFEEEGFIFVFQDVRGKFKSEGDFVVMRPHRPGKTGAMTDESSDTYDTIEWLLKHVPGNNGRVGMIGTSYPGFQVVHGLLEPHPALRAASPQAPPLDMFIGDDFHHNGAFRLAYAFIWLAGNAQARTGPYEQNPRLLQSPPDGYRFFLDLGPLSNADLKFFHGRVPEWNRYLAHPDYDEFWRAQNVTPYLGGAGRIPVLNVAGWFDAEDFYGPIAIYQGIERSAPENRSTLIVGPFSHGGWNNHADGNQLGQVEFAGAPAAAFRDVQFRFFRDHLKGQGELRLPEVLAYETGANRWRAIDHWPPRDRTTIKPLYFREQGRLAFEPPGGEAGDDGDTYDSNPARPVPATAEIRFGNGHLWMVEDQRFAATRPDVLVYQSDPLTEDLIIAGPPIANLFIASTGTDSDFVVKLIDVYPDEAPRGMGGYQMLLAGEVFRAKYRHSFQKPEPLIPGRPTALEIDLRDRYHRFLKGHRIAVQVQSTWFPVIDVNPGVFTNIYQAKAGDYRNVTQKVYRSSGHPSHISLPVVTGDLGRPAALGASAAVPAPEVVNARVKAKQPPDDLQGPPFLTAKAWAIAEGRTGTILWGKDEDRVLDMASLTKLMTALVVARLAERDPKVLDEQVTFSDRADRTIGSSANLHAGEHLPVRELLYGLLLPSGNDAAVALAEHFGGRCSRLGSGPDRAGSPTPTGTDPLGQFVAAMNRTAAELGLRETHFANPHGLTAADHHSSARDLAKLAHLALGYPELAARVSTAEHGAAAVDAAGRRRNVVWTNTNHLLEIQGYDGVKTGTTGAAGACLVASGRRGADHLIVVILGAATSESRYLEARNLFRWAWQKRGHHEP